MVQRIAVYIDDANGQSHDQDVGCKNLWSTVRKDGTANQLVSVFLDKANQMVTKLMDCTTTGAEETIVAQFLVGLGAVIIDVHPPLSTAADLHPAAAAAVQTLLKAAEETALLATGTETSESTSDQPSTSQDRDKMDTEAKDDSMDTGPNVSKEETHPQQSTVQDGNSNQEVNLNSSKDEKKNYECAICSEIYPQKTMLIDHIFEAHGNDDDVPDEEANPDDEAHSNSEDDYFPDEDADYDGAPDEDLGDVPDDGHEDEQVSTPSRRSSRVIKRPRKWDGYEEYTPPAVRIKIEPETEADRDSFPCLVPNCSSQLSTRQSLMTHVMGQHKYKNERAVRVIRSWYKPKPKGRPKRPKQNPDDQIENALDDAKIDPDVERELFPCLLQKCSSTVGTRGALMKHMMNKHKYVNETAVEVVQSWYNPKPGGRPKKSRQITEDETENTFKGVKEETDVEKDLFPCQISACTAKLGTRQTLTKHLMKKHKYSRADAVAMFLTWYKPKPIGRPKKTLVVSSSKESESFPCCVALCTSKPSSRRALLTHVMSQHKYNNQEAVNIVREWYQPKPMGRSVLTKQTPDPVKFPFVCEICKSMSFPRKQLLRDHICDVHELTKEQSDAEVAKYYGVLNNNRRRKLPDSVFYAGSTTKDEESGDINQASDSAQAACPKCGKRFQQLSQARVHFEMDCANNPLQCDICGSNFETVSGYKHHMETHRNKEAGLSFPCEKCDKVYYHKYMLTQHEASHKDNYVCEFCSKSFGTKTVFESHRNHHTKEEKYQCTECPKYYYNKRQLRYHVRMLHEGGDWDMACHICGKSVKKSCMFAHINSVHSELAKVQCPLCEKKFKQSRYLDDHLREVHGAGQKEIYQCTWEGCGKQFVRKRAMKSHYDTHIDLRPFSCNMCPNKFRSKSHLQNHLNWHNGVRPHQCEVCQKSFLTKGNLTKHMVTHKKNMMPSEASQSQTLLSSQANQSPLMLFSEASQSQTMLPSEASQSQTMLPSEANQSQTMLPSGPRQSQTMLPHEASQSQAMLHVPSEASQSQAILHVLSEACQSQTMLPSEANQSQTMLSSGPSQSQIMLPAEANQSQTMLSSEAHQSQTMLLSEASQSQTMLSSEASQSQTMLPSEAYQSLTMLSSEAASHSQTIIVPSSQSQTYTLPSTEATHSDTEAKELLTAIIAQVACEEAQVSAPGNQIPGDQAEYRTIEISNVPYTIAYTTS